MEIERSIQYIQLDHHQLLELIQKAFPNCRKLDDWKILSGGALNTSYKIKMGQNAVVLRIYARDRAYCKTEKAIHHLIDKSVSTPKLIYADEVHEPWPYSIFEFIQGVHISEVSKYDKIPLSYELGKVLASIHAFKFPQAGLFGDGTSIAHPFHIGSSPYFEEAFSTLSKGAHVRSRLGNTLTEAVLGFMQTHKEFFPVVKDNISLTHSDFKPGNLLYNTRKVFTLDWEFAHAGIGILDFAILLRHREQFPLDIDSLVKGYTDFDGNLEDDWFRSALLTDFVNIIQLLESPAERPKLFHQLINALENTMNNWDRYDLLMNF
ncbi:MAG TPA: aminoglycoside phosphotransferase family protein [Parachlamydiaceae bacterium]|nr:aminoglycoside phosphotransferase family protein [Parachlamydiaceae bacterium]